MYLDYVIVWLELIVVFIRNLWINTDMELCDSVLLNKTVIRHMESKHSKQRTIALWLFFSSLLAIANFLALVFLFGMAYQLDYSNASDWLKYPFSFISFLFAPIPILLGYIDSNLFRFQDIWYYIGAIVNAALWGNFVLYLALKNAKFKSFFNRLASNAL